MADNRNLFIGLIKGVLVGFAIALLFVIASALLSTMGVSNAFLTNIGAMGLFGFFLGLGLETYPFLI